MDKVVQKLQSGKTSICGDCFHEPVCRYTGNQPCVECTHFVNRKEGEECANG